MTETSDCPDRQSLARFLDPHASDEYVIRIEQHLLACDRCCLTMEEVEHTDTLVEAVRGTAAELPSDAAVQHVMSRLKAICLPPAAEETLALGSEATGDSWGLEQLLDPPQADGELGWFAGYRVRRVLGAGGMGLVFDAEDPQLQRHVALKVMKPILAAQAEQRKRFLREARAAAAIEHPHIVAVYQVGEHRSIPFLAMQLLKGESLDDRLRREAAKATEDGLPSPSSRERDGLGKPSSIKGVLTLGEALRIGRETAEALAVAHERRLIHRDVKPGNIWLESPGGWVKLLDFGLAHASEDVHLTQTGAILGTPAYMSPEQARGEPLDARSDLYSLGAVLYKLVTGDVPFRGNSTMAVLTALVTATPQPVGELNPAVPPSFAELIMRLLAKNADDRFGSAAAVVEAIRAIEDASSKAEVQSLKSPVAGAERSDAPVDRRPRWPWLIAAAGAAALLFAGIVIVIRDKDGREVGRHIVPDGGSATAEAHVAERSHKVAPALRGGGASASPERRPQSPPQSVGASLVEPARADRAKPFVLLRGGEQAGEFKSMAGVLADMQAGDEIEVFGNGPFALPIINLDGKPLTIRAGAGFRPRFERSPRAKQQLDAAWITILNAPLMLEGIELTQGHGYQTILAGAGAQWEIRRCSLLKGDSNVTGLIWYDRGPGMRIVDSVLISGRSHVAVGVGPSARVDFEDNVFRNDANNFFSILGGGHELRFTRNTFAGRGHCFYFERQTRRQDTAAVKLVAEENVFCVGPLLSGLASVEAFREACHWQGRRNLYGSLDAFIAVITDVQTVGIAGDDLARWNKFWGEQEQGALLGTHPTFEYEAAWLPANEDGLLPRLKDWLDPSRLAPAPQKPNGTDSVADKGEASGRRNGTESVPYRASIAGPDWQLVGPGQAYLRALAEQGHPVENDRLHLEALDEGVVVLFHEDRLVGGFATPTEAAEAAADGDTVAIRSNGVLPGINRHDNQTGRRLTLRAAYGYRPTLGGLSLAAGDVWSIEGLHFVNPVSIPNAAAAVEGKPGPRLVNCSFEPDARGYPWGPSLEVSAYLESSPALEVVNCLLPNPVRFLGGKLRLVNSAVAWISSDSIENERPRAWEFDRCVVWSGSTHPAIYHRTLPLSIVAKSTWFEFGSLRIGEDVPVEWRGSENVYCHGPISWHSYHRAGGAISDLADWQTRWPSDVDSREGEALYVNPRFHSLVSDSPGHQAGTDGKDLGADLSRLGKVAATPPDKQAASGAEKAE